MYLNESTNLFVEIATKQKLKYEIKNDVNIEVLVELGKQPNLKFNILLCLQNNDELWFYIENLYFCIFPFEEVKNEFSSAVNGFISGNYRILKSYQYNLNYPFRWSLQEYKNNEWKNVLTTNKFLKIPFLPVKYEILQN